MLRGSGGPPRIPLAQEHEYPLVKRWRLMGGMEEAKLVWPFFTTYMKDGGEKQEKGRQGDMGSDYLVTETAALLSHPIQSAD